jgi:hypothetical protein
MKSSRKIYEMKSCCFIDKYICPYVYTKAIRNITGKIHLYVFTVTNESREISSTVYHKKYGYKKEKYIWSKFL